ncbi:hypothetical protein TNCT_70191 [Trichonephila clavata]|uniref:Uncharacterized protein n=1 Tax=Trichonephila clavata TaxID=2740835 RepID=A0A8X6LM05_TRICU|nr:hypothetical protein TNCT_70191 [Trichonephila clavata]
MGPRIIILKKEVLTFNIQGNPHTALMDSILIALCGNITGSKKSTTAQNDAIQNKDSSATKLSDFLYDRGVIVNTE